jgi:hypothetical protein
MSPRLLELQHQLLAQLQLLQQLLAWDTPELFLGLDLHQLLLQARYTQQQLL